MGKLNYLPDQHLNVLSNASDEELRVFTNILIKDKDGLLRKSEDLTLQDEVKNYELHTTYINNSEYPKYPSKYWDLVCAEYQYFGGNTIANTMRGHGVAYEEILEDVCSKMKVNYPAHASVEQKEMNLLMKVLTDSLDNMTQEQKEALLRELEINTTNYTAQAVAIALQSAIRLGGFASYQVAVIIANVIAKQILGHGLSLTINAGISRAIGVLAGPIGWAITLLWTLIDLAGPAYRVTIPATIYIASLRQMLNNKQFESKLLEKS
jgi:uncharacterized protein YaaW (UPF0174 family)